MFLPTNDKQFGFWALRRSGVPNITIANQLSISRQAVSRALLLMDEKIEAALREMANANQIAIDQINTQRGILLGQSIPFLTAAIVFVSEKHGVRSGTSTMVTVVHASGTLIVSSCCGTMQPNLASRLKRQLTRQRWQKNCL